MSRRELMEPHKGDKRYVRRDAEGHFKEEVDVGRASPLIAASTPKPRSRRAKATGAIKR